MARMEIDQNLKNWANISSLDAMFSKITKKLLWLALPDKIH